MEDGSIFEGQVENGKYRKGKLIFKNGFKYDGTFDMVTGLFLHGKLIRPDSDYIDGDFKDGNFVKGKCKLEYSDGAIYHGDCVKHNGNLSRFGLGSYVTT